MGFSNTPLGLIPQLSEGLRFFILQHFFQKMEPLTKNFIYIKGSLNQYNGVLRTRASKKLTLFFYKGVILTKGSTSFSSYALKEDEER
jgi:hypothetical protein